MEITLNGGIPLLFIFNKSELIQGEKLYSKFTQKVSLVVNIIEKFEESSLDIYLIIIGNVCTSESHC